MTSPEHTMTIWYLVMDHRSDLIIKALPDKHFDIRECQEKQYEVNRFLYDFVGKDWQWTDKLSWSDKQWQDYAESPERRTWIAYWKDSPAGYFELSKNDQGAVELDYFGLANRFTGKGLGGAFLSVAIDEAWQWGAKRVQVNTCSLDHPNALANYQARGFRIYTTDTKPLA